MPSLKLSEHENKKCNFVASLRCPRYLNTYAICASMQVVNDCKPLQMILPTPPQRTSDSIRDPLSPPVVHHGLHSMAYGRKVDGK